MNITRWSRNTPQPKADPQAVPPAESAPAAWKPATLPQRPILAPEPDPFVSSGAFAFADADTVEDTAVLRASMAMPPAAAAPVAEGKAAGETPASGGAAPIDRADTTENGASTENGYATENGYTLDVPDASDFIQPAGPAAGPAPVEDRPVLAPTYDHRMAGFPAGSAARPAPTLTASPPPAPAPPAPAPAAEPLPPPAPAAAATPALPGGTTSAARGRVPAPAGWNIDTGLAVVTPRSATEVLSTLAGKVSEGAVDQYQPVPLGFTPLDKTIGGGLRDGELLLIGGAQGTGKTTMAVQMARNIVLGGQASVLYICFEHDEEYLLNRIIAMESILAQLPAKNGGVKLQDVRREILGTWLAQGGTTADLSANPRLKPALERINRYGPNLFLLRGSQTTSTVENMRGLVERYKELSGERRLVVFVDYMQKVPVIPDPQTEVEKVTYIVQGLKDVALANHVPMISIVAADKEGLKAARLRNHHLRGSSAINYEADIILILNEKYNIVAKVNIEFNPYQAQRFRDWVILSVEKNRGGQNMVDLEFQKHFEFSCFDANGRTVQEKLIEERLYND